MTGMKEGAGEDPFADDDGSGRPAESGGSSDVKDAKDAGDSTDSADSGGGASPDTQDSAGAADARATSESTNSGSDRDDRTDAAGSTAGSRSAGTGRGSEQPAVRIPYKFRRDGVQDGRNRVPLFLQSDTKSAEREALRELEERFDDDVSLTDLREALVKVGLQHLGQVESQLEEWGYGMTFEE